MKRIKELSIYELAEISEQDFKKLVAIEKAEKGIPLCLPEKPVAEILPLIKPVDKAYKINVEGINIVLRSGDDAKKMIDFLVEINPIILRDIYIEGLGYRYCVSSGKKLDFMSAETKIVDLFNPDDIDSYLKAKNGFDERGASFQDRLKSYNEVVDMCYEFEQDLWDKKRTAEKFVYELKMKTKAFAEQYIPLCDGVPDENKENVAMAFFEKAYWGLTEEEKEYILSNYKQIND